MEVDNMEEDVDGSILSVHVKNFFCHENLEITFNRNVNFIIGRNGSGKSAILTALVVGLGGRASATNRGNNLHSFIKKGANSATVEIKIKNNSEKAFKPNIYGDYITIVRNITASGSSSYKVKAASGEVISTKCEEVNAIILAHDIQVDNPISVLNQDDARSFHASDAKKKYSLFRKATNLDQTESNYVKALENCEKAKSIWTRKNEASLELEKELKKWETSYEQLQSRDEIEMHKRRLQDEYYWSEIAEFEREVEILQNQYDKHKTRIDKLVDKLSAMEKNFGNDNDTIGTLEASIATRSQEKAALEQQLQQLEGDVRRLQGEGRGAQRAAAKQRDLLARERRKVADLEREIQNINSGSAAQRRGEVRARADDAERAAAAVRARYDTAQNDAQQARLNSQRAATVAEEHAQRVQRQRDSLKHLKMQYRELESRGADSLAVYGASMVELVQCVREAAKRGGFSAMPRGPVGAYLKVKEKKWAGALEHIIGGSIQSFCVNNADDSRKLFEIMGKVYGSAPKPVVTCSKFLDKQHDVRQHKVAASGYLSALDSLDVSDPVIANFLIDNVGVEKILLVPEHEDAVRLSDNVENVPVNCAKVVTLDSTEYHPAPNYRSYGGAGRPSRYLQVSTADRKKQVQAEIQEAESSAAALEAAREAAARAAAAAREAAARAHAALQALLAERHERDAAARAASSAAAQLQAPHHRLLQEELDISLDKLNTINKELEELSSKEQEYKTNIDEYDDKMRAVKSNLLQVSTACRSMNEELEQEQLKLDHGETERQMCSQKLKEDRGKLAKVEEYLVEKRTVVEQKVRQALELCPRIDDPREKTVVVAELKKTQCKLNSIRSDGLTKDQVAERLINVQRKYKTTKHVLDKLSTLIEEVKKTADKHLNFCHRVQTYVAKRVQYCFQSILTLRGYSGRMEIDNARGALELACGGRGAGARRGAASTSSLSGGERSYSTVAFIMALWDCVELPFYFMDEFDVFMDNVNRKIVMELLIDHALKNTNRQFVFLTPQDASSVTAGPKVTIHRMADPRS